MKSSIWRKLTCSASGLAKSGARTYACRVHTRVNTGFRDGIEHRAYKMSAHKPLAVWASVPMPVHTSVNAARRSVYATRQFGSSLIERGSIISLPFAECRNSAQAL
jgi:hypothetical protein